MDVTDIADLIVGRVEPHIYAFTTNTIPNCLKVGDTYRPVSVRLDEWREHYPHLKQEMEASAKVSPAVFFRDYSVHDYLEGTLHCERLASTSLPEGIYYSNEFFKGADKDDVMDAIEDIRKDYTDKSLRYRFYSAETSLPVHLKLPSTGWWNPRPNQDTAVEKFITAVAKRRKNLLMYAVMRFGKSFTALCCARAMYGGEWRKNERLADGTGARLVVVVSAKADVCLEWRKNVEQAENFRNDYQFFSANDLGLNPDAVSEHLHGGGRAVVFLTLQDLQGETVKAKHAKLLREKVDLLIVDETHYGARGGEYGKVIRATKDAATKADVEDRENAEKMESAIKAFKANVSLHLSGTPYRILMGREFKDVDIISFCQFTDIVKEQERWIDENKEKLLNDEVAEWDNPYYGFPQMIRFAFNPSDAARKRLATLKNGGVTYAFSALFEPVSIRPNEAGEHRRFKFEKEILELFQVIDGSKNDDALLSFLDYDKLKEGKMCRHLVCVLPYCASCDALAELLTRNRSLFKNLGEYKILNISGHDMPREFSDTRGVCDAIRDAESHDEKTLTLTVNRMLTGSTVPEWDTMLYFKDTASPQEYDQAVFRLQNQYVVDMVPEDGADDRIRFNKKPQTLLVDFDPARLFRMQEAKSKIYNFNTDTSGNSKLRERIAEELRISPVVCANVGKLARVTPTDIMAAVREYSRSRGVSDEAKAVDVDIAGLAKSDYLLSIINRESEIDGASGKGKGFLSKPYDGNETELETPEDVKTAIQNAIGGNVSNQPSPGSPEADEEEKKRKAIEAKLRTYYARILFFSFLTKDKVRSIGDILTVIDKAENKRIARNTGVTKKVLKEMLKVFSKQAISDLDYKIENMSDLSEDNSVDPLERARTMLKKFDRFGPSEIVTPERIADDMVALLPDDEFRKILESNKCFLDIAGKMGEFAIAIYKRAKALCPDIDLSRRIYTIPTSGHAYEFTRKVYEALRLDTKNIATFTAYDIHNALGKNPTASDYCRVANIISQKKPFWRITMNDKVSARKTKSPFALTIGNPPYQEEGASGGTNDAPIYQDFSRVAALAGAPYSELIIKAQWFAGGREHLLGPFRREMLGGGKLRTLHAFPNGREVFPNAVEIKGGVCYYLQDTSKTSSCDYYLHKGNDVAHEEERDLSKADILVRDPQLASIVDKVLGKMKELGESHFVAEMLSGDTPFGIPTNPAASKKTPFPTSATPSGVFDVRLDLLDEKQNRTVAYVRRVDIKKNAQDIDFDKVFIAAAGGSGNDQNILAEPIIAQKGSVCSQTFIYAKFASEDEAANFSAYLKTKFVRILIASRKIDQHAPSKVYSFVPQQDFTRVWTDQDLYDKYDLSQPERDFIEKMIKPME